ncbi:MAG: hypothetical protein JKY02_04660 [Flavobacteriaceae bacterium]|nr:hypothetical protein [Flavobacteriaceae bacterium]
MSFVSIILSIGASLFLLLGIVIFILTRKKKKQLESELGIFHHPSNFKKQPVEWVQKPKVSEGKQVRKF